MPQPKRTPAKSRAKVPGAAAKAAVAELTDQPIVVSFRDSVDITLPPKLPATFTLDLAEAQSMPNNLGCIYRLIVSIVGQEQWLLLRNKVAEDATEAAEDDGGALGEMMSFVIGAYNVEPGESRASGTS